MAASITTWRDRGRELAAVAAVLVLCTLFVASKLENEFVFDDVLVVRGTLIHDPSRISEVFFGRTLIAQGMSAPSAMDTYRPMPLLTFFWDAWLSGHEPWAYHLTSHVLHLATVVCVFALARHLLPLAGIWIAAAVALFFGLSPQLGEAHVWINGRSDPLAALFGLLALLVWSGWRRDSARLSLRPLAAALLFLCGLLSKEVLVLGLPTVILWPQHRGQSWLWRAGRALPFVAATVVYAAMRISALHGVRASYGSAQVEVALKNLPVLWLDGLSELLAPSRVYLRSMRDEYALLTPSQRAACLVGVLLLALGGWLLRKRAPVLVWGSAWFACTLAPVAMISALLWPGFGRYLYLPCVGVALALGEGLAAASVGLQRYFTAGDESKAARSRLLLTVIVGVFLLSLGARLAVVTADYRDNKTLYSTAALASPAPAYAFAWLGSHYVDVGDSARSVATLRKAVELDPLEPRYLHDLVRALLRAGDPIAAEGLARRGIARSPKAVAGDLRALLVYALAARDPHAAVAELCTCLRYQPDHYDCVSAPRFLLDPRGSQFVRLRQELELALTQCPSQQARDALRRAITGRDLPGRTY